MSTFCNSRQRALCRQNFVVSALPAVTHGKEFAVRNRLTAAESGSAITTAYVVMVLKPTVKVG
jgi:hypothetical protein